MLVFILMIHETTVYEKAITTHRSAELLAKKHHFGSVALLADSLPKGAHVLDVGAGASPFGKVVAKLRPDITWINYDYSYRDPAILEEVKQDSPKNVSYVAGDATKLDKVFKSKTFDAVFSYWLLPHLSIDEPKPAEQTARAIFKVTKPKGLISIGPMVSKKRIPSLNSKKAFSIIKDDNVTSEKFVEKLVYLTSLVTTGKYIQKMMNEVATSFFCTTRYGKSEGKMIHIYNPKTKTYVSPLSVEGLKLITGLSKSALKYAIKNKKDQ